MILYNLKHSRHICLGPWAYELKITAFLLLVFTTHQCSNFPLIQSCLFQLLQSVMHILRQLRLGSSWNLKTSLKLHQAMVVAIRVPLVLLLFLSYLHCRKVSATPCFSVERLISSGFFLASYDKFNYAALCLYLHKTLWSGDLLNFILVLWKHCWTSFDRKNLMNCFWQFLCLL